MIAIHKPFCIIFSLFAVSNAFCQKINYTHNRLYSSSEYKYNIIGKVNDKLLVWQANANKHFASIIIAYNEDMDVVHTANTNILQSSVEPQPYFFVTGNSFKVIYKYQDDKYLFYKVAGFDEDGDLQAIQTLDSSEIKKDAPPQSAYSILQSADKKNVCFAKIRYDEITHALVLNCTYINDEIIHKDFAFSIDVNKEMLSAINIDTDKNMLLVFEESTDSTTRLKAIKKNFSDDVMLVTNKAVQTHAFEDKSVDIVQTTAGYIAYGRLTESNKVFIWQMDSKMNELAGDTVLERNFNGGLSFIPCNDNMANVFVAWNYNSLENAATIDDAPGNIRIPDYSNDPTYIVRYNNLSADAIATQKNYIEKRSRESVLREKDNYSSTLPKDQPQSFSRPSLKNIQLFKIDSGNSVVWSRNFNNIPTGETSANLGNSSITAGDKKLHIICEAQIKSKPRFLNHIIINFDGDVTEIHYTTWDMKYQYLLNQSVLTDHNELIVPAVKGSYMKFAKIKIE
ncbi:hypothetical protein [Parafilimonas sp.]|uniref:hypothetical protein n=1 Tax=Parafilimonas sp. TaxID=1969739 RepID=UPI003F7FC25D